MKKIYFAPKTTVVTIEMQQILAGSPGDAVLDKNAGQVTGSEGIGARKYDSFWDEEEDEY